MGHFFISCFLLCDFVNVGADITGKNLFVNVFFIFLLFFKPCSFDSPVETRIRVVKPQ